MDAPNLYHGITSEVYETQDQNNKARTYVVYETGKTPSFRNVHDFILWIEQLR